jgi:hypothetical protein
MLEDSIARRAGRTKPGNSNKSAEEREMLKLRRLGAVLAYGNVGPDLQEGIQDRVERILRGESAMMGARSVAGAERAYQPHHIDNDGNEGTELDGFEPPEGFDTPSAHAGTNNQSMAALLESATRNTPATASASNPRKRPLPTDFQDTAPSFVPPPITPSYIKRYKHAELYLDEDDLAFMTSAQSAREERFAALVERLARLVRLRDMRWGEWIEIYRSGSSQRGRREIEVKFQYVYGVAKEERHAKSKQGRCLHKPRVEKYSHYPIIPARRRTTDRDANITQPKAFNTN